MMSAMWKTISSSDLNVATEQLLIADSLPAAVVSRKDLSGGPLGGRGGLVLLSLHGGGLIGGSFAGELSVIRRMVAETGIPVVATTASPSPTWNTRKPNTASTAFGSAFLKGTVHCPSCWHGWLPHPLH